MSKPNRAPSKPAIPGGFAKLAAGGAFLGRATGSSFVHRVVDGGRLKRWTVRLVIALVALYVLWKLLLIGVGISTTGMWFDSVHAGSVYTTMLEVRVLLFCVFAVIAGLLGGLTMLVVTRIRPALELSSDYDTFRWTFRKYEPRIRPVLLALAALVPAILVGKSAAGGWQTYLLWRHATPFHHTDPLFHKDAAFYIEVYPFHQMVVTLLLQAAVYALWIALIAGYWYGAWRLRRGRQKITRQMTQLVSVLLAGYLVLKAAGYWLSRYGLTTSTRGPVTGAGYTDIHASLPAKYAMAAILLVCAALLVSTCCRVRRVRLLGGTVILAVVAAQVIGSTVPGLVYHYREAPSAATVDLAEIGHNLKATRAAFGLNGDVTTAAYSASNASDASTLVHLANTTAQASVIDPNQLSPTFNVKQQLQAYYGFKSTLDTGNYELDGKSQDVALAVRELQPSALPSGSWVNTHVVYTHGYGVVAAPTTEVDPATSSPVFLNGGMPPAQQIPVTRQQIYFGQGFGSSSYSIVGQPAGSTRNQEFDHPGGDGSSKSAYTTYQGHGGIPIGSALRRLLFAVQLKSSNIFFSSEVNKASQLLEVRNPAARVAKVAPWLTLDGDVYPAVVDGNDQLDRRRLHHIVELSRFAVDQSPLGDLDDPGRRRCLGRPAQHQGELHAELGEGRRRCLHRQGDALRVEPEGASGPAAEGLGIGVPRPGQAAVEHVVRADGEGSLSDRPVQRPAHAVGQVPRHEPGGLLQRQRRSGRFPPIRRSAAPAASTRRSAGTTSAPLPSRYMSMSAAVTAPSGTRCPARWRR